MTDRELVGVQLLKLLNEWNEDGRAFIDGLSAFPLVALRDALGGIAIACLRERWTSEAAVERVLRQFLYPGSTTRTEREDMRVALTAAMRDSE